QANARGHLVSDWARSTCRAGSCLAPRRWAISNASSASPYLRRYKLHLGSLAGCPAGGLDSALCERRGPAGTDVELARLAHGCSSLRVGGRDGTLATRARRTGERRSRSRRLSEPYQSANRFGPSTDRPRAATALAARLFAGAAVPWARAVLPQA